MKVNKLHLNKLFVFLNILYFVETSYIQLNNFPEEEGSGMGDNLISFSSSWNHKSNPYEQSVLTIEEKFNKSLTESLKKLEFNMVSLINLNNELLHKGLQKEIEQSVANKISKVDQVIEEKIKLINEDKTSYNVHELKCSNNRLPTSCQNLAECSSNIYNIMIPEFSNTTFPAVCDLRTAEGGWTIIQRRQDGSENFFRNWNEYVEGFGNMNGEFFIGLEKLHALTALGEPQELYIILEDFEGEKRYARYGNFKVDSNNTEYKLTVGKYSGDAGDCFTQHNGHKFSTKDRDNDAASSIDCATRWKGAWWFSDCYYSHLNGFYLAGKTPKKGGVSWCSFRGPQYSLKFAQMMIRNKRD